MLNGKKIVVVMPAYNAEKTLEMTYHEIPFEFVDDAVLVDDAVIYGLGVLKTALQFRLQKWGLCASPIFRR